MVPNLESPDVLGLQLPEILASTASGEGSWEFRDCSNFPLEQHMGIQGWEPLF